MADLVEAVKNGRPGWGLKTPDGRQIFFGQDKYKTRGSASAAAEKYMSAGDIQLADNPVAGPLSWSDVATQAVSNLPESAVQLGSDIVQPFTDPIGTAKSIAALGRGIYQKLIPGQQPDEAVADAVGQFFMDRYWGVENIKRTLATDPAGSLADLATVLTGFGGAAARAPSALGKVGRAVQTAADFVDPVTAATKVAAPVAKIGVGLTTGVGSDALSAAAKAGKTGGQMAKDFLDNMRGKAPLDTVVNDANKALARLREERAAAYTSKMAEVTSDPKILDFGPITKKLGDVGEAGLFHGKVVREEVAGTFEKIANKVQEWAEADPAIFRTVEGLDALKQAIGSIRQNTKFGTPDRKIADEMYHAVREVIAEQAPDYADIMSEYERATGLILEIQDEFKLAGKKAKVGSSLKALQSIMRNNVYTNWGRRGQLAKQLEKAGAATLRPKLAGQALHEKAPRGLARVPAAGAALYAFSDPTFVAGLPLTIPRLMGETAYYGGKWGGLLGPGGRAAFQAGRLQDMEPQPPYAKSAGRRQ